MIRQLVNICYCLVIAVLFVNASESDTNLLSANAFKESHSKFASDLYSTLIRSNPDQNIVVSPFSVNILTSLLFFGAGNDTAEELKIALRLSSDNRTEVSSLFHSALQEHISDTLQLANKMYLSESVRIQPEFKDIATKSFNSETENVVFADKEKTANLINGWIKQKTHDKIQKILSEDDFDSNTQFALVNAIYFKSDWLIPFEDTVKAEFWTSETESTDVSMMMQTTMFETAAIDALDAKVVQLNYKDSDIRMLVFVPNKRNGLQHLENQLSNIDILGLRKIVSEQNTIFGLPKFKIEFTADLKDTFIKMGMPSMFSKNANFANLVLNQEVYVDKAVHKAFIEVTETGTEAGAATGFSFKLYSIPQQIIADRPFMYAIVSDSAVLFIGRYVK